MDFITYGVVTDEGKRVLAYLNGQCQMAEARGVDALNGLSGHVGFYYVNVYKTRFLTEADWLRSYPNAATAAWLDLQALEEAKAQQQQQAETQTAITESLAEIKTLLADALARIDKLEAKDADPTPEPEPEPEPEAVESKKAGKKRAADVAPEAEAETEA